jgi:hypothetical protein
MASVAGAGADSHRFNVSIANARMRSGATSPAVFNRFVESLQVGLAAERLP